MCATIEINLKRSVCNFNQTSTINDFEVWEESHAGFMVTRGTLRVREIEMIFTAQPVLVGPA